MGGLRSRTLHHRDDPVKAKDADEGVHDAQEDHAGAYWPSPDSGAPAARRCLARAAGERGLARDPLESGPRATRPRLPCGSCRCSMAICGATASRIPWRARWRSPGTRRGRETGTLFEGGRRLLTTLADVGIDTLMLKGGALAATVYGDPGLRPDERSRRARADGAGAGRHRGAGAPGLGSAP